MYRQMQRYPVIAILVCGASVPAFAQNATFTYQGLLKDSGANLTGQVDLEFSLFDADTNGGHIGVTLDANNVDVVDGLFTVDLDFGAAALNGGDRWLEIAIANPAGGSFTTLSPRQPLTASPFAIKTRGIAVDDLGRVRIGTTNPGGVISNSKLDIEDGHILLSNNYGVFSANAGGDRNRRGDGYNDGRQSGTVRRRCVSNDRRKHR